MTASLGMKNPLDPSIKPGLPANEEIPPSHQGLDRYYYIFIPRKFRQAVSGGANPIAKISLYFGPNVEINRHGLRTFFNTKEDRVLITIPGVEGVWIQGVGGKKEKKSWGIGISSQQIDDLFKAAGLSISWEVRIMAAFSTGYRGMNGTINNGLISLNNIDTIIFYDCLYRGDEPKPGNRTNQALTAVKTSNQNVNIITYEVTDGGTPRDPISGNLYASVPTNPIYSFAGSGLIRLKDPQHINSLKALCYARIISNGINDGYFARTEVPQPILDLIDHLPPRGTIATSPHRIPKSGFIDLDTWASSNSSAIGKVTSTEDTAGRLIVGPDPRNPVRGPLHHLLVGWDVKWPKCPKNDKDCIKTKPSIDVGDLIHDFIDVEFGWEFLAGP